MRILKVEIKLWWALVILPFVGLGSYSAGYVNALPKSEDIDKVEEFIRTPCGQIGIENLVLKEMLIELKTSYNLSGEQVDSVEAKAERNLSRRNYSDDDVDEPLIIQ